MASGRCRTPTTALTPTARATRRARARGRRACCGASTRTYASAPYARPTPERQGGKLADQVQHLRAVGRPVPRPGRPAAGASPAHAGNVKVVLDFSSAHWRRRLPYDIVNSLGVLTSASAPYSVHGALVGANGHEDVAEVQRVRGHHRGGDHSTASRRRREGAPTADCGQADRGGRRRRTDRRRRSSFPRARPPLPSPRM